MPNASRSLPAALLCVLVGTPALAGVPTAAPPSPPTHAAPAPDPVAEHLRHRDRARHAGRWEDAERAYRAAWQLQQRPDIAGELGAAELALGRHREAAEHLQIAVEGADGLSPEQQLRFQAARRKAEQEVATLAISVHPPQARLFVDGRPLGPSHLSYLVYVEPGRHTIRATLADHEDTQVQVDVPRGRVQSLPLRLPERKPAPAPAPTAPPVPSTPPGPSHRLEILATATMAVFGVSAAVSSGMMVTAEVVHSDAKKKSAALGRSGCHGSNASLPACDDLRELNETRDALSSVGSVGMVVTLSAGVAALLTFWWSPPGPSPAGQRPAPAVRVQPLTAGDRAGILLDGRW